MFASQMQPQMVAPGGMWSPQYYSYVQDDEDVNTSLPKEIKDLETKTSTDKEKDVKKIKTKHSKKIKKSKWASRSFTGGGDVSWIPTR